MRKNLVWKIYFLFYILLGLGNLNLILSTESDMYIYYHILMSFNSAYVIYYTLNVIAVLVGLAAAVPLFLYAFDLKTAWAQPLRWFLFLRILCDAVGHTYEIKFTTAAFHSQIWLGLSCIGLLFLPPLPCYLAHYLYAFRPKSATNPL